MLIYIHGFNSSAQSHKACLLQQRMETLGFAQWYAAPNLGNQPLQAMATIEALLRGLDPAHVTVVGSSLGGYYATYLVEQYGVRAVLVNPAVRPYQLLATQLGMQRNLYTGESYELTPQHLLEWEQLEVAQISVERYWLITASGDEVLDYREGLSRYKGCLTEVIEGGDHGCAEFVNYLDKVIAYWQRGRV